MHLECGGNVLNCFSTTTADISNFQCLSLEFKAFQNSVTPHHQDYT